MSNVDSRCLDAFPDWLRSLADDATALAAVVLDESQPEGRRRALAGALNYLFKSLDLIPDGIEDLGYLDDAFVFRVAAAHAATGEGGTDALARLAGDTALLKEFLAADYARLEKFVAGLESGSVRGRTVEQIVTDGAVRSAFASDVKGWTGSFVCPSFGRDAKNLVKLRSFLTTKLPA
ncbi:MAG TPA: YkvA family protein [Polyangiaceae bacterium]